MKCTDCGGELPFKVYGDVKCEYCNTANIVPVPGGVQQAFEQHPEPITKGTFRLIFPGTHARFNVEKHEVTICTGLIGVLHVKVDGKKLQGLYFLRGKKEWIFEIGENYVKVILETPKFFSFQGLTKVLKYEVYITKKIANYKKIKTNISDDDPISKLERLGKLKEQGLLTEEEFITQKEKIL